MSSLSPLVSRVKLLAQHSTTIALDLLFPPYCVNCERVGSFLCPRCVQTILPAQPRIIDGLDGICVRAGFEGATRNAIHAFKYERQTRLAGPLGDLICQALQETAWPVDLVTAVPLHAARLRERGYNQAALIGQHVAFKQGWGFAANAIERVRETTSQTQLNAQERRANVQGAFRADGSLVAGKQVLVVDDVLTTGATLCACADALRAAGAIGVYGAAIAGAVHSDSVGAGVSDTPV